MKAEHRKELHTNVLADRLGKLLQGFREGFGRPSNTALLVWGGIFVAIVLLIGWKVYSNARTRSKSAEWRQLDEASNFGDLEKIAGENPGSSPARIVRYQMARVHLRRGMENFCSSSLDGHENALEDLNQAATLYGELSNEVKDNPVLIQEALLGVAKAKEALGELDAALAAYEQLAERYPNSVNGKGAAERAKKLKENKDQVSAFYRKLDELTAPVAPPKKD
jgi:tetratricopeptide (TPR) repeat protein